MMKKLFLNDKFILLLIILYSIIVFISGFNIDEIYVNILTVIDYIITILFVIEAYIKIKEFSFKIYFSSNWNKFDFIVVLLSIPSLFLFFNDNIDISFLLTFRILRTFKSFRFLKFIPGIDQLIHGIGRAMKASILVLVGFSIYIFIISIFSFYLFKNISIEYFGDPLLSMYSIFKIFTMEGWFEIPEMLSKNLTEIQSFFTYCYFIFILLTGGIFGLSLVNSIFVDAMLSDNNDELERKIDILTNKINNFIDENTTF